ncbi:MAG: hypothetical protein EOO20_23525 [Chryseobacterium sp.]|nr:MAG: hypothetical protein EOO20_23525 [Chryseobacterium sp.]
MNKSVVFSTLSIGSIIVYLGKKIIDRSLDLAVEKFKGSMNIQLETHKFELLRQADDFRATLKKLELEHQVKYSRLHEERAQTIKQLYALLIDLQDKLGHMTSKFQGPEWTMNIELENASKLSLANYKEFFLEN